MNRLDGETNSKTQDPNIKYLNTPYKKELMLSPTDLNWISDQSNVEITMNDDSGITFTGHPGIRMDTTAGFSLHGNRINIESKEQILISTPQGNITIDKIVDLYANGGVNGV